MQHHYFCNAMLYSVKTKWCASETRDQRPETRDQRPCILCCREPETLDHLLVGCVFARTIWYEVLSWCRLTAHPPDGTLGFFEWLTTQIHPSPSALRKGFTLLAILTAWSIWKHRNAGIFDGLQPSTARLLTTIQDEARDWAAAGVKGPQAIIPVT
uniref:Reverse transcriptase zinc-binding domain-containing protein n=1 Tax=Hordeum vulgare subsp. vulgare TaxID=112509 RepID=A0A8I6YBX2_HORVV